MDDLYQRLAENIHYAWEIIASNQDGKLVILRIHGKIAAAKSFVENNLNRQEVFQILQLTLHIISVIVQQEAGQKAGIIRDGSCVNLPRRCAASKSRALVIEPWV